MTELPASETKYRIMIIDDSATCRNIVKSYLTSDNFEVTEVADSTLALKTAKECQPVVILTDVQMPDMDGYDVCKALKADEQTQHIPVLFVTSEGQTDQKVKGFEAGGADYIPKTADQTEVIARVRTHVRIACLQNDLFASRDMLAERVYDVEKHMERERELRKQVETQQTQMLQNEKMASIGALAAGVAHEINNPIGFVSSNLTTLSEYIEDMKRVITAYTDFIEAITNKDSQAADKLKAAMETRKEVDLDYLLEDLEGLITDSVDGTHRVRKIVADLRDFSHVDSPDVSVEDINSLVEKTINVATNELKYKAEVVQNYGKLDSIPCFGGKLGQVFLNLLVNAAHAIETRGTITVSTGQESKFLWIEIADTGSGIPEEALSRIFDPFYTTKDVGKGTGLGLHLSHNIVEAHGGNISVKSKVGEGTTFRIELPLTGPPEAEQQHDQAA